MKIVLDTNVLIAAALADGLARNILIMAAKTKLVTLVASKDILNELQAKLRSKFDWSEKQIAYFLEQLTSLCEMVYVQEKIESVARDPKDNKILECAVAGQADLIVTADWDLITLKQFQGIAIIHPKTLSWTFPQYFKKSKN